MALMFDPGTVLAHEYVVSDCFVRSRTGFHAQISGVRQGHGDHLHLFHCERLWNGLGGGGVGRKKVLQLASAPGCHVLEGPRSSNATTAEDLKVSWVISLMNRIFQSVLSGMATPAAHSGEERSQRTSQGRKQTQDQHRSSEGLGFGEKNKSSGRSRAQRKFTFRPDIRRECGSAPNPRKSSARLHPSEMENVRTT
jgi:hypothetical protein